MRIKIATAGNGIGSLIINIKDTINIIIEILASICKSWGVGRDNNSAPKPRAYRNHFFWVAQNKKLLSDILENPNKLVLYSFFKCYQLVINFYFNIL